MLALLASLDSRGRVSVGHHARRLSRRRALTAEQTGDKMVEGLAIGLVGGFGAGLVVAVAVIKFYLRLTNQQVL